MDIFIAVFAESWEVLVESAPYMLFGFVAAGLLKAFLPEGLVAKHLGNGNTTSVLKASLLGVPLPLCSCAVIPAAAEIRRRGASKGATAAFLISTPETGVDSIAVTYALLGPVMAVVRPLAAFATATFTGLFVNLLKRGDNETVDPALLPHIHGLEHAHGHGHGHGHGRLHGGCETPLDSVGCGCGCAKGSGPSPQTLLQKVRFGLSYAFGDLLGDIGLWFLGGVLAAGLISALIPPGFLESLPGGGAASMLLMLLVAVPLYVCATASTPIAAALALKGVSPGAALVFLLAGPATNAATIAVAAKILGRRAAAVYLGAIVICSLALGLLVDAVFAALGLDVAAWTTGGEAHSHGFISLASAVVLPTLIAASLLRPRLAGRFVKKPRQAGNEG